MRNHNDNVANYFDISNYKTAMRFDPLSTRMMASYTRQVEMARFLRHAFGTVRDWLITWNRRGDLNRALETMPDYLLKDIGIRRDQIDAVAAGRLRREAAPLNPAGVQAAPAFAAAEDKVDPVKPLAA